LLRLVLGDPPICTGHNWINAIFGDNTAESSALRPESDKVNSQIGVNGFENEDHFCPPPVIGHVTRRMRSDS